VILQTLRDVSVDIRNRDFVGETELKLDENIFSYSSTVFLFYVNVQVDRRESTAFKIKKYSVNFQLEMDLFLQN